MAQADIQSRAGRSRDTLYRESLPYEHGFEPLRVEGELPAELRGTLYRDGPGLFELFGRRYGHPFEGDGVITAVRLEAGQACGAARIIESRGLVHERAAGRMIYGFSAPAAQRLLNVAQRRQGKNTGNTNVIWWKGRLFALMEAARPTEIAPDGLATLGETDLGGIIRGAFSAHPHRVPTRRAMYNIGLRYGKQTYLDLYELPDSGQARHVGSLSLTYAPMIHDFMVTGNHVVLLLSPVRIRVMRTMLQMGPFHRIFEWTPRLGTEVIAAPIDALDRAIRFHTDAFFQWHYANAFERDGRLVVDIVRYRNFDTMLGFISDNGYAPGTFHRITIDPERRALDSAQLSDVPCEFPRLHPDVEAGENRYAWLTIHGGGGIGRLDVDTGELVEYLFDDLQSASEPVFVPRAGARSETDGYVLTLVYDGRSHTSFLAVIDGQRLPDGPVARAFFDHHIPATFHGNWVAST